MGGKPVQLEQQTAYPWNGDIRLTIQQNKAGAFALKIRIPGWVIGRVTPSRLYEYTDNRRLTYQVSINGKRMEEAVSADGYLTLNHKWKKGDRIDLHFDMEPRIVKASNQVEADRGRIAVERGPLVYCAEFADNDFDIMSALINQKPSFTTATATIAGAEITTLTTDAQTLRFNEQGQLNVSDVRLRLIPYYAWCHRGSGKMRVWIPQELSATSPTLPATLASVSKLSASVKTSALSAVNDRLTPKNGDDRGIPYYHWWPAKAQTEWLQYDFPEAAEVSSATVYWFDDGPWGGCRVPKSWRMQYMSSDGEWEAVEDADQYPTDKGCACTVHFKPVTTKAVRLEVTLPDDHSAGLFEWSVGK